MSEETSAVAVPSEEAPFPLTDADRWVLSQTDEEFKKHDWEDLKQVIGELMSRMFRILILQPGRDKHCSQI